MPSKLCIGVSQSISLSSMSANNFCRRGVGNFDWEEFVPLFGSKTYDEINAYLLTS